MNKVDNKTGSFNTSEPGTPSYDQLQERLFELEAVVDALRDHQVDAIVGETDVALVHLRQVEEALRESGERYRAFVANSSEGIWRYEIDPPMPLHLAEDEQLAYLYEHGYVAECNDAMANLWGYARASDMIGLHGDAGRGFPHQTAILRHFIRSRYRVARMESEEVDPGGHHRWLSLSLMGSLKGGALTRTWGVQRDITARRQNEEDLRARTDELTTLLALTRDLASTVELEPLLAKILARLHGVVEYTSGYIAMIEGKDFQVIGYDGPLPRATVLRKLSGLAGDSPFRSLLENRRASIMDLSAIVGLAPASGWSSVATDLPQPESPSLSWLLAPLVVKDQLIGVLAIEHKEAGRFGERQARLVEAFADHCAVAIENARLFEQSRQLAVFNERQRLAGELHDSVSQSLYGISLGAHTIHSILDSEPARVREVLDHVLNLAEAAFSDMRTLIFELRPEALERHGLVTALSRQAEILRRSHQIRVHLALGSEPKVPADAKEVIYRIAQESLHNITKHAQATEVWVKLNQEPGALCLTVHDNGSGFDPLLEYEGHLGLRVMRERAERCHGSLEITSAPAEGTTVRATVPIQT